jgi:hypothetical protein
MISRYNKFKEDLLLESLINESLLYYSPNVRKVINKITKDNSIGDIAKDLISSEKTDVKPDVTFIDLDKEGYLSFITMRNAAKTLNLQWPDSRTEEEWGNNLIYDGDLNNIWRSHESGIEHDVYKKSRNSIKIGKLINKLFPGKYNDKQIEEFVNKFKATIDNSGEVFEIVEGEDIEFWYDSKNYAERSGTLGNSCMAQKKGIFNIYTKNPEVCRMLILKEDDKILGRALIWKLNSIKSRSSDLDGVEYFMDRQYTIKDSDVQKFRNYAKEQKGWVSKAYNNHHSFNTILNHLDGDKEVNVDMTVKVKKPDSGDGNYNYRRYPYLDTLRRFDPGSGTLYNDEETDGNEEQFLLHDTGGGYETIEGGHWSEWHDRMIPEDQAVYSDRYGDWLDSEYAVRVERGSSRSRGWYHQDDDDVVYDESLEEYIHVDDAVYSEAHSAWFFNENAVKVIVEIDSDGDVDSDGDWYPEGDNDIIEIDTDSTWYEKLSDKFSYWSDFNYIVKERSIYKHGIGWTSIPVMTKNSNDEWIPYMFKIELYKLIPGNNAVDIMGVEYLSQLDAEALGYKIDKESEIITDEFKYHSDIEELLPKIYKVLSDEWVKIIDSLRGKGQLRIKFQDFNEDEYLKSMKERSELLNTRLEQIEDDTFIDTDITITRNN